MVSRILELLKCGIMRHRLWSVIVNSFEHIYQTHPLHAILFSIGLCLWCSVIIIVCCVYRNQTSSKKRTYFNKIQEIRQYSQRNANSKLKRDYVDSTEIIELLRPHELQP